MSLLNLPQELLLQIATHIERIHDIYHLALVSRFFSHLFEPEIHKRDALDQYGVELLRYAAKDDRGGILKMISLRADINFSPPASLGNLKTVLHSAIQAKNIELVKFLLENGAQPNLVFKSRMYTFCALHMAVDITTPDDLVMINLLLDYGADPNLYDAFQQTPLLIAVQTGHLPKMELLIARGADVNRAGRWGTTPLLKCIERRGRHMEFLINSGSDVNCVNDNGISPLMLAMRSDNSRMAESLIHAGADVHFTNSKGRNAFLDAAMWGMIHNAELLLNHGADLHFIGPNGRNALYDALWGRHRHIPMLKFLLERGLGSEIDSRDANQQTPLIYAASYPRQGNLTAIQECSVMDSLLNHGASITAKDIQGATVLHYLAKRKAPGIIKWLCLEKATSVNECDVNGESPIFWALKDFGRDDTDGVFATVRGLLDLGADYLHANAHGQTLLCMAAYMWCPQSTSLFLERGADIHHRDNDGRTPLHWFAANKEIPRNKRSLQVLEILLAHGADVNTRTHAGATPLSMIRKKHTTRHIRKMLVDAGAEN